MAKHQICNAKSSLPCKGPHLGFPEEQGSHADALTISVIHRFFGKTSSSVAYQGRHGV